MFKVNATRTFEERVEVLTPAGNGQYTKGSFLGVFEMVPEDELKEYSTDRRLAERVLKGVREVADEGGTEMDSDAAREAVLQDSCAVSAILSTYQQATRAKNLRRGN